MASDKKISITFDDGPNPPYTEQILKILEKKKIPATFFVCGKNIERYPQILKKTRKEGHIIGNHSYNHNPITTRLGLSYGEIMRTQILIERLTGQKERYFRPPWGYMPFWLKRKLQKEGFKILLYDITGKDWRWRIKAETIVDNVINHSGKGGIILLHDGKNVSEKFDRSQTIAALPVIIDTLTKQGFSFVPLSDIVGE